MKHYNMQWDMIALLVAFMAFVIVIEWLGDRRAKATKERSRPRGFRKMRSTAHHIRHRGEHERRRRGFRV